MVKNFSYSTSMIKDLQTIERVKQIVHLTVIPPLAAEQLRNLAFVRSTHYSTMIEGNRLTLKETEQVIQQGKLFPGRERDVAEVERYYQALQQVEKWVEGGQIITEERIRKLHAIIYKGKRSKATPYRDGQNVIRETSGEIVYMPPEANDVPQLMNEMVNKIHTLQKEESIPAPIIAGIAHYDFVTIHPFYDGNGRTARTLATWILYQNGYDLGKFYSLEEFYAEDLAGYYNALITHPHHNYYFGRHEADITSWLEYFVKGMAVVFERVAEQVQGYVDANINQEKLALLRPLDHRARRVLSLFTRYKYLKTSDVANLLGVSDRQARDLCKNWVEQGWLVIADASNRGRKYSLSEEYKPLL